MTQRFIFLSAMVLAASATASAGADLWKPIGPPGVNSAANIATADSIAPSVLLAAGTPAQENSWTSHGPKGSGLVWDVATTEAAVFAATTNGVFRSVDGGASWVPYGLARESISQVLTTPGAEVVWATVQRVAASGQLGWLLYASRDGGKTWDLVPDLAIRQAAIDPWHPTTFYAGAAFEGRIWKSKDAGSSWQPVSEFPGVPGHFEFDSVAIYVRTDDTNRYYRSSDGGATWAPLVSPLSHVYRLAAGAAPGVVYASGTEGFCSSVDSASTWTCSNAIPGEGVYQILELPGQSPRIVGLSQWSVYATDDLGATWAEIAPELSPFAQLLSLDSDVSGSVVLVGTSDGILRSQDRGGSWAYSNDGIAAVSIRSLALGPGDPSTIWAATGWVGAGMSDPQLFRSEDGGLSWEPAGGPGVLLNGHILTIAPGHPATLYTASGSAVYRSDDSGESWTSSPLADSGDINALAIDPRSAARVLAATSMSNALFDRGRVHRSEDGGRTWTGVAELGQEVHSLLIDGRNPGTVYAGSYYELHPEWGSGIGGSIFVSRDGGATFTKGSFNFGNPVIAILADPTQDGGLYVATSYSNQIFRSVDNGAHWVGLGDPDQTQIGIIRSLVVDPVRRGRLYAATSSGVYRSVDGARTWQPFYAGLSPLPVHPLAITPDGRWLHVGTRGAGVFQLDLENPCAPSATRLCLVGNRYAVDLLASRPGEIQYSPGAARPLSDRAGYFGLPFVTGDPELPEVVVKMLPDGAFGVSGAPTLYSSLTTLPYVLTVTDTVTGQQQGYASNPSAPLCGGVDLPFRETAASMSVRAPAAVAAIQTVLPLLGGRFSVTLEARHPGSGRSSSGVAMSSGDRFGFFSLPDFTGDPQFPEVVVKMLDARSFTGTFWFFHTGLTNLDYTLTVTDSATGAVRTYESGAPFCGGADTNAFTD